MIRATKIAGAFALVLGLTALVQAEETKGTIKTVDQDRREVVLKGIIKDSIYELDKDAAVWLDGFSCKLGDLRPDDRAVVIYDKSGDHFKARTVRGLRNAKETTGTVKDVFGEKREVTLKGVVRNTTYELIKGGTVWVDGKKASLGDIREGDEVMVTYAERGDRYVANDFTIHRRK